MSPQQGTDPPTKIAEMMHGDLALTPVTVLLVSANLVVFGAMLAHGADLWHSSNGLPLEWGAGFGPATKNGEWWRLGTAMFLHFGLVHLVLNMWALWDGGRLVERLYGPLRFAVLYIASGLTGNLVSLITHGDLAVSGGASGAIFGVYGALLVCLWRERGQIHPSEFRWLFWGAAVFSAAAMGFGLLVAGIDNAAHAGGLATGALAGVALARPLAKSSTNIGHGRWLAVVAYAVALIALVLAIPAPSYNWKEELHARKEIREFLREDQRILNRWQHILEAGQQGDASFEQLAGQIETDVAREYRQSFEQLSALHLDPAAPSTMTLGVLRKYTQIQGEASQSLAEALRTKDPKQIREAIEMARQAPYLARGIEPPPPPVSSPAR